MCALQAALLSFVYVDLAWRLSCVGVFSVVVIVKYTFQNGEFCKNLGKIVNFVVMFLCISVDNDVINNLAKFQLRTIKINRFFRQF